MRFNQNVIPGITTIQTLTVRHGITLNRIGRSFPVTTGRLLAQVLPDGVDDVVVMLDARCTFSQIEEPGVEIYWGAYLGTPDETYLLRRDLDRG